MSDRLFEHLSLLRAAVGYLGEREQHAWWQSSFFSPQSPAFLAPVFGRTQVLAQCVGVARAAAALHDAHIGVGQVHHLFRLPEELERALHRTLRDPATAQQITAVVLSREDALAYLRREARVGVPASEGPTRVGDDRGLHDQRQWELVAAHYVQAFERGLKAYPYFTESA